MFCLGFITRYCCRRNSRDFITDNSLFFPTVARSFTTFGDVRFARAYNTRTQSHSEKQYFAIYKNDNIGSVKRSKRVLGAIGKECTTREEYRP